MYIVHKYKNNNQAVIHVKSLCSYVGLRGGGSGVYTEYYGDFPKLQNALAKARSIAKKINICGHCDKKLTELVKQSSWYTGI